MATLAGGTTTDAVQDGTPSAPPDVAPRRWLDRLRGADRALIAVVVLGGVLRLWGLGAQSLWYDEWLTAEAASGSLGHLRHYVTDQAGIPPTYFAVMWVWARVVGDGDGALRVFSALVGVATIPVAYAAVQALGGRRAVARTAALLVAVHPMLVWYSQEARPYSLLAFCGVLSLWALARVWAHGRRLDLVVWAVVCAFTVAVHYFAVFLVVAEVVALLAARRLQRRDLLAMGAGAAVVLVPLAPFAIDQFTRRSNHSWITDYPLSQRLSEAGHGALVGPSPPDDRLWLVAAAVVAFAAGMLVLRGDRGERRAGLAAGGLGLGAVGLALAANVVGIDIVIERYLIASMVLLVVAVAVGLGTTAVPRGVRWAAAAALCATSLGVVVADARDPHLQRADWRAVAGAHQAGGGTGERLLVMNFHGYLGRPLHRYLDGQRVLDADEEVTVDRIDFLDVKPSGRPCNGFIGRPCTMIFLGAGPPEALADSLELDERVELDQFTIDRYRADGTVTVTLDELVPPNDLPHSLVYVTPGS